MSNYKINEVENNFGLCQDFNKFSFEIGYSYSDFEEDANLFWISFMFWTIDFSWKPLRR